jgi:peptidoglycan glycosyltransferase
VNKPIRRVAIAVAVLVLALVVNLNWIQVVKSDAYRSDPANRRVLLDEYSRQRGSIVVQGKPIAQSIKTNDRLKYLRTYPGGAMYAPLTGYYSLYYGTHGLERTEDKVLSGSSDKLFGNRVADLLTGRDPRGGNVELTINAAAQEAAYKAMAKQRGAVVAIDPTTGAILAAVSFPSYDPALLSSHDPDKIEAEYKRLSNDPDNPMLKRAFNELYPPGSVFKVVTAAAAIRDGQKPGDQIAAPDAYQPPGTSTFKITNFDGERCGNGVTDTMKHAFAISCNTAFAKLAVDLGEDKIRDEAARFGIDDQSRVCPLPVVPSTVGAIADDAALAQTAIGQRDVRVTPLQAAMIAAAVANDGTLMQPYLIKQTLAPNLTVLSGPSPKPGQLSTILDPDDNRLLKEMMLDVVQAPYGTGTAAQIPGVQVAGKTGTADTGRKLPNGKDEAPDALFSGFAPYDNPKIAVAVILENAGVAGNETTGGLAAAPIAKAVMQAYLADIKGR